MHQVFVLSGEYKVSWKRCGFEKRRRWLSRLLVAVVVVIGGDVNREAVKNRRPVSHFVSNQIFVLEIGIADQTYQGGNTPRSRNPREVYADGGVGLGGRAHRSRDRCPKHVMRSERIGCSGARHVIKPSVVVVRELCSNREVEPVRNQRNFILDKSAEYLRREVGGIQGNDEIAVRMRRRIFVA